MSVKLKNRKNLLLRYRAVLAELNKYNCVDIPITVIWRKYIYPKFYISRQTLYNIINTDVEKELQKIEEQEMQINSRV